MSVNRPVVPDGKRVTLTATVKVVGHVKGTPTGIVTFTDGTNILGIALLRRGKAVLKTTSLAIGDNSIVAMYNGDQHLTASQSAVRIESITVDRATPETTERA